jgi:hypothetical protein
VANLLRAIQAYGRFAESRYLRMSPSLEDDHRLGRRRRNMSKGLGWRVLTWVLMAQLLVNACATVPLRGTGGSGRPVEPRGPMPGSEQWEELEDARRAELESVLAGMWGVAGEVREVGTVLEFTFWVEGGAFTQMGFWRHTRGRELGDRVDQVSFTRELREILPRYTEGVAGLMRLSLRREERRWRADFKLDTEAEFPLEAKTWPVQRVGLRAEVVERLAATGREVASRLWAPAGVQVRWQVEVELEDERVTGLETRPTHSLPGGKSVRAAPETIGTWVNVLAPFTQGLGPRKVRVEWEGEHIAGSGLSRWRIVAAEVVRPPPPTPENAEVVLAYRAMHEQILREWREQTREGFQQLAVFSAEQVALFVIAGVAARGLAVVMEAAAPMIARALMTGGTHAVGWVRSLVARALPAEKQALGRLMAKAETQGLEALSATERAEVLSILRRMEASAVAPLEDAAKDRLRRDAQARFYQELHPDLSAILRGPNGHAYDIHHCIPMEFAHKFPLRDINAAENLAAAAKPVHASLGRVWTRLRKLLSDPDARTVEEVERLVRKHYGRWFNKAYDYSKGADEALEAAERAALEELEVLLRAR